MDISKESDGIIVLEDEVGMPPLPSIPVVVSSLNLSVAAVLMGKEVVISGATLVSGGEVGRVGLPSIVSCLVVLYDSVVTV